MAERDIRVWYLMRRAGPAESLFFIPLVSVEEDESGQFGATLRGLETRLVAMGQTQDEAEHQAIELFKGMVDHALTQGAPLEPLVGNDVFMKRVHFPIHDATKFFEMFDTLAKGDVDRLPEPSSSDNEEWRFAPVTPVPILETIPA